MEKSLEPLEQLSLTKERGTGFPKLSLSSAVGIMEKAFKYGKQWKREQFASFGSKAGAGSANSGAFRNRVASLKDFGLIDTSGVTIVKTDLSDQIVRPLTPEEREGAIRRALLNVDVFRSIIDSVEHGVDLSKTHIAEKAVTELGVSRAAKDTFVTSFVDSGKFAGIIEEIDHNSIRIRPIQEVGEIIKTEPSGDNEVAASLPASTTRPELGGQNSTSFSSKRSGNTWELIVQVKSSKDLPPETVKEIVDLIGKAENIAKSLSESEVSKP